MTFFFNQKFSPGRMKWSLGGFAFDVRRACPAEVLFEFLNHYDEVLLPDGQCYRMENSELQEKIDQDWHASSIAINDLIDQVQHYCYDDWAALRSVSKKLNCIDLKAYRS